MSDLAFSADELQVLVDAVCDGAPTELDVAKIEQLVRGNADARQFYLRQVRLDRCLRWEFAREPLGLIASTSSSPTSLLGLLSPSLPNTVGYFSSGWPLAYLVATVICGIGLVIGSFTYVSQPAQVARQSAPIGASNSQSLTPNPSPKTPLVGRITGMVDCRWERKGLGIRDWGLDEGSGVSGQNSGLLSPSGRGAGGEGRRVASGQWPVASRSEMSSLTTSHQPLATSHLVFLGDTFALRTGLMEITYNSGAKVILQGPVTYEVESAAGGYLSLGKLTARVEGRGARVEKKVASGQWPVASRSEMSSLTTSHQPLATSVLATNHYPLFTIKTPTATVTDLGTEFGVEVSREGLTQVHVLQGVVDAQATNRRGGVGSRRRLTEGSAVEIERGGAELKSVTFAPRAFTRKLQPATDMPAEAAYIHAVLADNPRGYWPLNEPAGTQLFRDRSGNSIHGYGMNKVEAGQPGPLGDGSRAAAFKGNQYIDLGRQSEFSMKNNFTVEAWLWIDGSLNDSKVFSAVGRDGDAAFGWGLGVDRRKPGERSDHPVSLCFNTFDVNDYGFAIPAGTLSQHQWVHVAVVYDRDNTAHLYLDGRRVDSVHGDKPATQGLTWLYIGGREMAQNQYWRGRLAHVAVYPYTLSAQQIEHHYNQNKQ